jgi:hypothetical protein
MAKAHAVTHPSQWEPDSRHRGRTSLAEVVPIRPGATPVDPGPGKLLSRIVQVFASLRAQAASVEPPPCPPSPPAPLHSIRPVAPDAA